MRQVRRPNTKIIFPPHSKEEVECLQLYYMYRKDQPVKSQHVAERLRLYREYERTLAEYQWFASERNLAEYQSFGSSAPYQKRTLSKRLNQIIMDQLINEWVMCDSEYTSLIQWLPQELMEDLEGYIRHFRW